MEWSVGLSVCVPAGRRASRQAGWQDGRQASRTAGRLERGKACCPDVYVYTLLFIAPSPYCFITTLIDECIVPPICIIQTPFL